MTPVPAVLCKSLPSSVSYLCALCCAYRGSGGFDLAAHFSPEVSEAQRDLDAVIEELDTKLDR